MICQDAQALFQDDLDGSLSTDNRSKLRQHLGQCHTCTSKFDRWVVLSHELKRLPRPELPDQLIQRVISDRSAKIRRRYWRNRMSGFALAATIVAVVVLAQLWPSAQRISSEVKTASLQSRQVNFLVDSRRKLEQVQFTLDMPKHVSLQGYAGQRQLNWSGQLQKGKNLLKLPLIPHQTESGILVLRIKHGELMKEFKVKINSQS